MLSVPGVKFVILPQGTNDIEHPAANDLPDQAVSPEQVISGLKQLIARAHAHHVKIFGDTLLPGEGAIAYTAEGKVKSKAVNDWIRTSKAFDGVIDFEAVVRDPDHPTRLRPEYAPAFPIGQEMANQTLRRFVRISVGGKRVRIRGGLK